MNPQLEDPGLTVGQVARAAQIAPSAVRYYERIGLLPAPERVGGWRRYPPSVLERLRWVGIGRGAGFSLDEIRVLLDGMDAGEAPAGSVRDLAMAKLPELEATLVRTQLLVQVMRAAATCRCPSLAECADHAQAAGV